MKTLSHEHLPPSFSFLEYVIKFSTNVAISFSNHLQNVTELIIVTTNHNIK